MDGRVLISIYFICRNKTRVGDCEVARRSVNVMFGSPLQLLDQVDAKGSHHFTLSLEIFNYHSYNTSQNYDASLFYCYNTVSINSENSRLLLACTSRVLEY